MPFSSETKFMKHRTRKWVHYPDNRGRWMDPGMKDEYQKPVIHDSLLLHSKASH